MDFTEKVMRTTIKEIVKMTKEKNIDEIAAGLPIGAAKLRTVLKEAGCKPPEGVGKKGWTFDPKNGEIEKQLNAFTKPTKKNFAVDVTDDSVNASNDGIKNDDVVDNASNDNGKGNDAVNEIKNLIMGKKKDEAARVYKGFYLDKDIADFFDNVQHGNKSEIINRVLRQYLTENKLM